MGRFPTLRLTNSALRELPVEEDKGSAHRLVSSSFAFHESNVKD